MLVVQVFVHVIPEHVAAFKAATLDNATKRILEPRAASPSARLKVIRTLTEAGVPVGVNASPMIPFINDHELEHILEAARDSGAIRASTILVRLPREVSPLFREWLAAHFPDRAQRVLHAIRTTGYVADPVARRLDGDADRVPVQPARRAAARGAPRLRSATHRCRDQPWVDCCAPADRRLTKAALAISAPPDGLEPSTVRLTVASSAS